MKKIILSFLAVLFVFTGQNADAISINSGYDSSAILEGAVRFKNFTGSPAGGELYLGTPNLGIAANRVETDLNWTYQQSIPFVINYTPEIGILSSGVNSNLLGKNIGDIGDINYLQLDVVARTDNTSVSLNNLVLNGSLIGDFTSAGEGWKTWNLTDINYSNGFIMSGELLINGYATGNEVNKAEISFGSASAPVPEPTSAALALLGLAGLAGIRTRK